MKGEIKSIYIPIEVAEDIKQRKKDHNFDFSAWITNVYKRQFLSDKEIKTSPEEILVTYTGDLRRLYTYGIKKFKWTLSYEEFVKLKKV